VTSIAVNVRQTLSSNLPFVIVLSVVAAGILYSTVVPEHWLRGVVVTAIGVLIAGTCRLALSDRRAGMLRVRTRAFDTLCYFTLGGALIFFGSLLPR
jgi:hypothetical protein